MEESISAILKQYKVEHLSDVLDKLKLPCNLDEYEKIIPISK